MTCRTHWAWYVLTASFATVFVHYSIRLGYGILMPEMILSLQITKAQAGSIATSFFLAYSIFAPLMGFLADRVSARTLLVVSPLVLSAGTFLMGRPQTLVQACLSFFVVGVGASAMWTPVVTLVQRWFVSRRRGMALGILSISYAIGYGMMGILLPPLADYSGWRSCWSLLAAMAFLLVPLNGIFIRTSPQDLHLEPWGGGIEKNSPPPVQQTPGKTPFRALLRWPSLWMTGLSYFFISFSAYVFNLFIVTYGNLELKYPFAQAARLATAIAFAGIPGALLIPSLSDSIGRKKCLILINAGMTISILLIIWAGSTWSALLAAVSFYGIFYASVWPMYAATAADFFPREVTGSVLGFWTIFYGLALILAPVGGGYLADLTGTFESSFLAGVASGCLATLFLLPLKKQEIKPFGLR
ncbi:MAG: MFS transporter [Syntrophaceae bacterium]|nr:MFS transporter [Syntrophaceae bacterium]